MFGFKKPKLPGKETVDKLSTSSTQYAIEITQGGRRLVLEDYKVQETTIVNEVKGKQQPIVMPPITLEVATEIPRGLHNIYLCSDKGSTCSLKPVKPEDIAEACKENEGMKPGELENPLANAEIIEGKSVWELRSHPQLTKRFIDSNALSTALSVMGSKMSLIIGFLAGFLLSAFIVTFIGLALRLLGVF